MMSKSTTGLPTKNATAVAAEGIGSHFHYVVILDDDSLAFLAPLLDPKICPSRVILVAEEHQQVFLHYTQRYLTQHEVQCETWLIPSQRGLEYMCQSIQQYLSKESHPLALNMGKTHTQLALLLQHYFLMRKWPIFYCSDHYVHRVYPQHKQSRLKPVIHISDLCFMRSFEIQSSITLQQFDYYLLQFTQQLLTAFPEITTALGLIHYLADTVDLKHHILESERIKAHHLLENQFKHVIEQFEQVGCFTLQRGSLLFTSPIHHYLCRGGWVFLCISDYLLQNHQKYPVYDIQCAITLTSKVHTLKELTLEAIYVVRDQVYACVVLPYFYDDDQEYSLLDQWHFVHAFYKKCKQVHIHAVVVSYQVVDPLLKEWGQDLGVHVCDQVSIQNLAGMCDQLFESV